MTDQFKLPPDRPILEMCRCVRSTRRQGISASWSLKTTRFKAADEALYRAKAAGRNTVALAA